MSAKKIDIMNVRQLLLLKQQGESNRSCERMLQIHRNTINTYVRHFKASGKSFSELLELSDKNLVELFPTGSTTDYDRYSELVQYFPYFKKQLHLPGFTREYLWREYLQKHPEGYGYTQFNEHFNNWLNQVKSSGKLHHKAGDKMYVDYTGKKLQVIDKQTGEVQDVEVFVAVLPASGYTYVEASRSQKLTDFIESMTNALNYFGGSPKSIVTDNLKSAVTKSSKYEPVLNKTLKDMALHYSCVINPTRSYSPQDKALVENAVKLTYQRVYFPMRNMNFFSLEQLNKQIRIHLNEFNNQVMKTYQTTRKKLFLDIEKNTLNELPTEAYQIKTFKQATVQKMGYIFLSENKNYYSVPFRYIGKKVEVQYNNDTVEIYNKSERIAVHKRQYSPGRYITVKEHLSSSHNFYSRWNPEYFNQLAQNIGEKTAKYVSKLIAQQTYPEVGYKQALGIIHMAKAFEKDRIENACTLALAYEKSSYRTVKRILENNMDKAFETPTTQTQVPFHENIRGSKNYQ
jgi:transposase